jgi:hypothetical protein
MSFEEFELEFLFENFKLKEDLEPLYLDILNVFKDHFKIIPPLGYKKIKLKIRSNSNPICVINYLPDFYVISHSKFICPSENCDYGIYTIAQAVSEFSHELTHIFCNPYYTCDFIECICIMNQFYFLKYFSKKYENKPEKFWFDLFLKRLLEKYDLNNIKLKLSILYMFENKNSRDIQTKYALKILPYFEKNDMCWKLLPLFYNSELLVPEDKSCTLKLVNFVKLEQNLNKNNDLFILKLLKNIKDNCSN